MNNNNNNNNTYMKQQPQQQSQQQTTSSSHSQTSSNSSNTSQLFERQLGASSASCAAYQQLPGYHDSLGCKACQYPQHSHHHSHHTSNQQHPGSQAAQVNRLYGGGLVKAAVEPNPELATNPVPAKVSTRL